MKHPTSASIRTLLEALHRAGVEFIVVGGAAATLHGSGTTTEALDIVPSATPENIDRLLEPRQGGLPVSGRSVKTSTKT